MASSEVKDPIEELSKQQIGLTTPSIKANQIRAAKATIEKRRQFNRGGTANAQTKYDNLLGEYKILVDLAKVGEPLPEKQNPGFPNPANDKDRKAERAAIIEKNKQRILIESARKALPAAKSKLDAARNRLKMVDGKVNANNTDAEPEGVQVNNSSASEKASSPAVIKAVAQEAYKAVNGPDPASKNAHKVSELLEDPTVVNAVKNLINKLKPPVAPPESAPENGANDPKVGGARKTRARRGRRLRSTRRR
jgi:hypothetical protein